MVDPTRGIPASDPRLDWTGRVQRLADGSVRFAYPGVSLSLRARAARVVLRVAAGSPDCWFDLIADDGATRTLRLPVGESDLVLAEGMDPQRDQRFTLVKRTESWMGVATVREVRIAAGVLLSGDPPPLRRLLFIGDSITCGACVDCLPPDFPEGHGTANATRSFGLELGRRLAAQVHLVSYGGRGVQRDYQGHGNEQVANAPVFFERTLADDAGNRWDHDSYQPDGIIVGLGTNDFATGIPEAGEWIALYARFAERLREAHPAARVLLTTSPMIGPRTDNGDAEKAAALTAYLAEVVRLRAGQGDARISSVSLPYLPGARNSHPDAHGHQRLADFLEPVVGAWFAPASSGSSGVMTSGG